MCLKKEGKICLKMLLLEVWKCSWQRRTAPCHLGVEWMGCSTPLGVGGMGCWPSWAWSVERLSCCCCFAQFTSGVVYLNWNSIPWIDSEHKKNLPFRKDFREIPFSGLYSFAFEDCLWIRGCSHWELMLGKGAQNKSPRTEPIFKKEHF